MLGYPSGRSTNESHFGKVPNNFIMDEVQCDGTELDIRCKTSLCQHSFNTNIEFLITVCQGCVVILRATTVMQEKGLG